MKRKTILKVTTIGLALALLGCGSSATSQTGNFSNGPTSLTNLDGNARQLRISVPPGGGSVTLPRTQNLTGTLTFGPGAAPDIVLTLTVTETAPPGTEPDTLTGAVQRDGFYYILWDTNKPFDFALVQSIALTEVGPEGTVKPRVIADDAELYQAELSEYSQGNATFAQAVQGRYDNDTGGSIYSQPDSLVMQPGTNYLFQAKSIQTEVIPVTVVNNSGVEPAYFCVLGQNPNAVREGKPDPDYYRVSADGKMVPFDGNDRSIGNTTDPNGKVDGYTELYNIPIPNGTTQFNLPQMSAGRMYISLGRKMQIRLEDDRPQSPPLPPPQPPVRLAQPNGWTNPGDPNYLTLFDWLEFDYKVNGDTNLPGIGINKTEVDMMGFGVQFTLQGPTIGSRTVGTTDDGRQKILDDINADNFFKKLIVPGPAKGKKENGTEFDLPADIPLRAIAPVKGLENSQFNRPDPPFKGFDLTYFDQYLTHVWTRYKSEDLKCYTSAFGIWYGRVDANDKMVFTCVEADGTPRAGFEHIYVRKPSTTNAFEPTELITSGGITYQPDPPGGPFLPVPQPGPADQVPHDGDDPKLFTKFAAGEIVSALSAAMNRTTLLHEPLITRDYRNHPHDLKLFYKKDAGTPRINVYAKAIHDHSLTTPDAPGSPNSNGGGAAYAFGFDDNSNQSSFLSELSSPTGLKIVITRLKL
ncbi:MAG: hypothetical protein KF760_06955 [Candidatus Eremiobacteraeota bacterium]|nr:hypothetical protein [Candidatus Eremiobacteraeota bacterium]MCW5866767.1 hypothetical protein [Candidatus Eremiobacteraeota bacterium]